jgi:hypothetical protein
MARPLCCAGFKSDFLGYLCYIAIVLRRKLDLMGVRLRLSYWMKFG